MPSIFAHSIVVVCWPMFFAAGRSERESLVCQPFWGEQKWNDAKRREGRGSRVGGRRYHTARHNLFMWAGWWVDSTLEHWANITFDVIRRMILDVESAQPTTLCSCILEIANLTSNPKGSLWRRHMKALNQKYSRPEMPTQPSISQQQQPLSCYLHMRAICLPVVLQGGPSGFYTGKLKYYICCLNDVTLKIEIHCA